MENKKYTDEEVIKALECCGNQMYSCTDKQCKAKTLGDALDLINRQKAEIERLNLENLQMVASIKRLKSEAIKEFWNELKRRNTLDYRIVSTITGDNLVKEMTEKYSLLCGKNRKIKIDRS